MKLNSVQNWKLLRYKLSKIYIKNQLDGNLLFCYLNKETNKLIDACWWNENTSYNGNGRRFGNNIHLRISDTIGALIDGPVFLQFNTSLGEALNLLK